MSSSLRHDLLFRSLEADAWRRGRFAEIDEFVGRASVQRARGFLAKIRDRPQVVCGFEELIHAFPGERQNIIEGLTFGIDQRQECWGGEIHPNDAAVRS